MSNTNECGCGTNCTAICGASCSNTSSMRTITKMVSVEIPNIKKVSMNGESTKITVKRTVK